MHPIVHTWEISHKMNELLINNIPEEHYGDQLNGKGRTAAEQFAHLHNVRLMWLQAAKPELMDGLTKLEKGTGLKKKLLLQHLKQSQAAISKLLEAGLAAGKIKGFKPHPEAFLGYLIAHEAHHRGQILNTLKFNGHLPDKKTLFGLWEWGRE
ncbi:MAG: DinB family protein [Chitinophagaceae bacterium]|nr:DinB family protein [Chitinophagaceae bacterium]